MDATERATIRQGILLELELATRSTIAAFDETPISHAKVFAALYHTWGASAQLRSLEKRLAGRPEPKIGE